MGRVAESAWIATWITISVSLILTNKYVLGYTAFRFPIMLAFIHMLLASASSRLAMSLMDIPDTIQQLGDSKLYVQLAAIGIMFGLSLVLGNSSFIYLSVPTIQMLKAGGPASIFAIGICLGTEEPHPIKILKVFVVCAGVALASYGDLTFHALGMTLQVSSILADAVRCCYLQKVLQHSHVDAPPMVTLSHVAPFAAAALVVPMSYFESSHAVHTYADWRPALPMVLLSGVLAACLNFVVFKLIQITSALTTSLLGVIKEWICIIVAMHIYMTVVTGLQWLGYSVAIAGLIWYQTGRSTSAVAQSEKGMRRLSSNLDQVTTKDNCQEKAHLLTVHAEASAQADIVNVVVAKDQNPSS